MFKQKKCVKRVEFVKPNHNGLVLYESIRYINERYQQRVNTLHVVSDGKDVAYQEGFLDGLQEALRILTCNQIFLIDSVYIDRGKRGKI